MVALRVHGAGAAIDRGCDAGAAQTSSDGTRMDLTWLSPSPESGSGTTSILLGVCYPTIAEVRSAAKFIVGTTFASTDRSAHAARVIMNVTFAMAEHYGSVQTVRALRLVYVCLGTTARVTI